MKKILLFLLLALPLAGFAQKSYVHIYLTEGLKINESFQNGSTLYLTGDIPSGIKDYYYYTQDMTMGRLMTLFGNEGFILEKAFEVGEGEVVIMSRNEGSNPAKIQSVQSEDGTPYEVARYNLQGIPVKASEKGVQIIVYSNYTTKTVVVE